MYKTEFDFTMKILKDLGLDYDESHVFLSQLSNIGEFYDNEYWNVVTGCSKLSDGCLHCYSERKALSLRNRIGSSFYHGFQVKMHENELELPLRSAYPCHFLVSHDGDLFHDDVPLEFIQKVFDVMSYSPRHIFKVVTKRSERLKKISSELSWSDNIWMGVTVESADYTHRIADLKQTPAAVKFLVLLPLLSRIRNLDCRDIDLVIAGGENGPEARVTKLEWLDEVQHQCLSEGVPIHVEGLGSRYEGTEKEAEKLIESRFCRLLPRAHWEWLHDIYDTYLME